MSGVRFTGDSEGEHNVLGEGGGYVVARSDLVHDAGWKVSSLFYDGVSLFFVNGLKQLE